VPVRRLPGAQGAQRADDHQRPSHSRARRSLQVLERNTSIRQASLAQELGFAQRSVTQAIEGLERDGLVERTSDPTDGRAKLVTLTADGAAALAASTDAGNRALQQIFGSLDREQLTQLDALLTTIDTAASAT